MPDSTIRLLDVDAGLRLRPWRLDDLDVLVRHADDAHVAHGVSDRFPHPYTRADGEAFRGGHVVPLDHVFAIERDGAACGGIGIGRIGEGERRHGAEFGYWLGRAHWGRGIMSRAVATFAPWAMHALRLHRLQAMVLDFNTASARLLARNGFVEEGVLRRAVVKRGALHDLRLFAITREELDDAA